MGRYAIFTVMALIFGLVTYNHAMISGALQPKAENIAMAGQAQARIVAQQLADVVIRSLMHEEDTFLPETDASIQTGWTTWADMESTYAISSANQGDSLLNISVAARHNGQEYTIAVVLEFEPGDDTWDPDLSKAVFASETIRLEGSARIRGHVGTNSTAVGGVRMQWATKIDSSLTIGPGGNPATVPNLANPAGNIGPGGIKVATELKSHPMPVYPEYPAKTSPIVAWSVAGASSSTKNPADYSGKYIPSISVTASGTLYINTNNQDQVIHTSSITISGSGRIIIQGTGHVTFYVENGLTIQGSATFNASRQADTMLMYFGGAALTVDGSTQIRGDLFAKLANITLTGSGGFQGHIVTGGTTVSVTGAADAHSRVIYAPAATVTLSGSGKVTGTVIARHYIASGSADVWFATGLEEKLPPLKSAVASAPRVRVKSWY